MVDGIGFVPVDPVNAVADALAKGATLFDRPEDFDEFAGRIYFTVTEPADTAATSSVTAGRAVRAGGVYTVNEFGTPRVALFAALNDPAASAVGQRRFQACSTRTTLPSTVSGTSGSTRTSPTTPRRHRPTSTASSTATCRTSCGWPFPTSMATVCPTACTSSPHGQFSPASPCQNEWSGGEFRDIGTFFVNQQHLDNPTYQIVLDRRRAVLGG